MTCLQTMKCISIHAYTTKSTTSHWNARESDLSVMTHKQNQNTTKTSQTKHKGTSIVIMIRYQNCSGEAFTLTVLIH